MNLHKRYLLVAIAVLSASDIGRAQTFAPSAEAPEQTVIASPTTSSSGFGKVLAIENGILVVGDPFERGPGFDGAAYVYTEVAGNSWRLEARLTAGHDSLTRFFGVAVALATNGDSTAIIVGSWDGAYVFTESDGTWGLSQRLVKGDTSFGWTLSVHDDILVGTSELDKFPLYRMTSLGVFEESGEAHVPNPGYGRGRILLLPDRIIARSSFIEPTDQARIQILRRHRNSWVEETVLSPPYATGSSVLAGFDSTLAIQFATEQCCHSVRFFSYSGSEWTEESTIESPASIPTTFGSSIALIDDLAIIGAGLDPGAGVYNGAVYIYQRSGQSWQQRTKIAPWPNAPFWRLGGQSIATDGRFLAAHADGDRESIVVIDLSVALSEEAEAANVSDSEVEVFPNPFSNNSTISYKTDTFGRVQIRIVDLLGRIVDIPVDAHQNAGQHRVEWKPTALASGHYFVVFTSGSNVAYYRVVYGPR